MRERIEGGDERVERVRGWRVDDLGERWTNFEEGGLISRRMDDLQGGWTINEDDARYLITD